MSSTPKPSPEIAATVREAYPKLRRFFAKKVSPAEVQDLAQETIVTFLEKDASRMDDPRRFLFGIARNKLLQHFDRRRPGQSFDSQVISARQVSTTLGTKLHRSTVIIEGMRSLPLEWQIALELRYGEDLKLTEVAEAMQMSLAQVKRYIKDGLAQMRAGLRSDLDDESLGQRLGVEYRSN
jgi:RNA polymerase sigma-70 factor (ECF subfamily)